MSISQNENSKIKLNQRNFGGILIRLRDLREDRDLTQKQVADFLSIKQNTYSQYENGVRQLPIDLLIRLSRYYTVSTDYILELTNVPEPYPQKAKRL